jgi:signal transduction histidine kinase
MLGNLIDNACKWGRRRIAIATGAGDALVHVTIQDDGPGLSDGEASEAMRPGQRIDESAPGYGFGLPITRELAELYGGSLVLFNAQTGGLKAVLSLPAAS